MTSDLLSLVRRHLEAENAHDLEGTLATLHPECRFDDFATGQSWFGREGAAAHYTGTGGRPSTSRCGAARASGARSPHGRHVGRFLGIEPTGRTIVQPFVVSLSFRDGLMLGERFHYDLASLVRQITADPLPAVEELDHRNAAVTGSDR
jgi:hypothetical protein